MTTELTMLAWAIVLGLVQLLLAGQATTWQLGFGYGLSARDEKREPTGVPARLVRAFSNYMQSFPFFAAAVLVAHVANRHSGWTTGGAQLYVWARLAYVPLYASGIPGPRTVAFLLALAGIGMVLSGLT